MLQINCPNCGAKVTFRAGETVYAVCDHCATGLVRDDVHIESIGKVAVLQDSWSPLQIGTEGDFDGGHFFVVGKVVFEFDSGNWSEWFLSYNDGRTGWMTEAQGHYALSFEVPVSSPPLPLHAPQRQDFVVGKSHSIGGDSFTVVDIKEVTVSSAKGELPFKAFQGRESTVIDFTSEDSTRHRVDPREGDFVKFASYEFSESDGVSLFVGSYRSFESLKLTNLRVVDGW